MSDREDDEESVSVKPLLILGAATVLACVIFGLAVIFCISDWEHRGQFGDMFGGLNAVFSGLAFAGVIYAILLQRRELAMQREEMRMSREELAAQNQLITAQLATMQESLKFETTKEALSSEPVFRLGSGSGSANERYLEVVNLGGRITDIGIDTITPDQGIGVSLDPTDVWDTNNKARIYIRGFGGRACPDCVFDMRYKDKLGRSCSKRFRIPGQAHKLEPIEKSARYDGDTNA
jgi:hypothetical protein